ncbi:2-hydroxyacid dehydrogenase [Tropicimonas isoalkanivorans]|uniref:Glyoxylate/hydroxypyruvate reductase A n=1 Tax=Tropicimonas isoalkanivorans TaxID=441112 RepID=A0A1I1I8W4_9RHOB|nr:glyoxylate/hydroxypyruvate reductase A [Tropicimonas isoalkanivorans]SFC29680.1 glyoxylate/hydroxypyruvate reductase A [Tropicimonas isoalkanivorans]
MSVLAHDVPEPFVTALRAAAPDLDIRTSVGPDPEAVRSVLIWLAVPDFLETLPNLSLVLSLGAGVERLMVPRLVPDGVHIGRISSAVQAEGMSDYVLLHVLRQHRRLSQLQDEQARGEWRWRLWPRAGDVAVGVMGLGALGADAARKLAMVGFRTRGWSRTRKSIKGVACHSGANGLAAFLADLHHLVCLLPLTPATTDILNADLFAQLAPGAFLINAGRGGHLVEADLLPALNAGHLEGVTLDVLRQEPPPADHPFFADPRILLTPHSAVCATPGQLAPDAAEACRRAERGAPPPCPVDRERGY